MEKIKANFIEAYKNRVIGIYLMAFLIPFNPRWLGIGVALILLEFIISKPVFSKEKILKKLTWRNPGIWLFLFYILHIVGLLHTENMGFATMDLGMKSTLAIFPILFLFYSPKIKWDCFVKWFIYGAIVSILVNSIWSLGDYMETGKIHSLTGANLTHLMHRGYWAIYLLIALFFCLKKALDNTGKSRAIYLFGAFLFTIFILLSESKLGIILLGIVLIWALFKFLMLLTNKKLIPLFLALFVGGIFLVYNFTPSIQKRFKSMLKATSVSFDDLDKTSTESTTLRLFVWDSSIELIKENFWFGVGTGDIKDALIQKNYEKGYIGAAEKQLNSHNQFFNSHIALGVFAPLLLLMIFSTNFLHLSPVDSFYKWRIWIVFFLFMALLPESMMEIQAGIIPYAFLLTFLTSFESSED